MAHGLIRGSFVPDAHTQELRALLRTRKQFVRERSSHIQRLQKTLEDANIKLDSALSDVMGLSGRAMIKALIAGQSDPDTLAGLAHRRVKATPEELREALRGRVTKHTASCCNCTSSRSMPSTRRFPRSIGRSTPMSSPFAQRSPS